jgi:hypothetical protein
MYTFIYVCIHMSMSLYKYTHICCQSGLKLLGTSGPLPWVHKWWNYRQASPCLAFSFLFFFLKMLGMELRG